MGEATITLQDVDVLLGLRVDGDPVTGPDGIPQDPSEFCQRLFGFIPKIKKSKVSLISLHDHINTFNQSIPATQFQALQRVRCFVAYLLAGSLFCDKRSTHVDMFLLTNIEDVHVCGSALLAQTYRELSTATQFEARDIDACGLLIHTWAWERIARVRPEFRRGHVAPIVGLPLAARWSRYLKKTQVANHSLVAIRDQLSWLGPDDFDWTLYDERYNTLPDRCRAGHDIWGSVTYLHYYHIVEPHQANMVMRQFGLVQSIPSDPLLDRETQRRLQALRRSWKSRNWAEKHAAYLDHWNMQAQYVVHGMPVGLVTVDNDYFDWYNRRTVHFVEDPGRRHRTTGYLGHTSVARSMLGTLSRIFRRGGHQNDVYSNWTAEQITDTCLATGTQISDPTIGSSEGYTQMNPSQGHDLPHARERAARRRGH
ncbi:serine/threonine-protein phosphatase 7 long form homolog [Rutidosis leptorrhynchoides]|uniref:serine/threonine-protein phosphatase 7 long form homolog n=1 Tax=Rutidosis leptorrhynchoides TaxID=125765 RepID=UPI003A991FFB